MTIDTRSTPSSWGEPRSRTVQWHDPMATVAGSVGRTGLEIMQAIADGELPPAPIGRLMNFGYRTVGLGEVSFTCEPDESHYNPIGVVHGGLVCTLLDSVTACAVHTTLPAGVGYTSLELKVSYLRAVRLGDGPLVATGRVTRPGSKAAFAEGEVVNAAGKVVATATTTCLVFPL